MTYNKIVENCFTKCVYTFNYRYLTDEEASCVDNCTNKAIASSMRIGINFGELQLKKMQDAEQLAQQQQQTQPQTPLLN